MGYPVCTRLARFPNRVWASPVLLCSIQIMRLTVSPSPRNCITSGISGGLDAGPARAGRHASFEMTGKRACSANTLLAPPAAPATSMSRMREGGDRSPAS